MEADVDYAFVVGGNNSSNTYQLYRVCAANLGESAYFIQNERNIQGDGVSHYVFPQNPKDKRQGIFETRSWDFAAKAQELGRALKILITGGASCPDGIIQQVITRINGMVAESGASLRDADAVLAELESTEA